jgi:hypothetical protein
MRSFQFLLFRIDFSEYGVCVIFFSYKRIILNIPSDCVGCNKSFMFYLDGCYEGRRFLFSEEAEAASKQLCFINSRTELLGEGLLFTRNPVYFRVTLERQLKVSSRDIKKEAAK